MADPTALTLIGLAGYAGKKGLDVAAELVTALLKPSSSAAGDALGAWVDKRIHSGARVVEEAMSIVKERGHEIGAVPPYILLPLIERASLAQDDDLRATWAALLANAADASGDGVLPSFASILFELSGPEVQLLSAIYASRTHEYVGVIVTDSDGTTSNLFSGDSPVRPALRFKIDEYRVYGGNLTRLGLCYYIEVQRKDKDVAASVPGQPPTFFMLQLTALGMAFVTACRK